MSINQLGRKTKESLLIILLLNIAVASGYAFLFTSVKATNEHISDLVNEIDADAATEDLKQATRALVVETAPLRDKLAGYLVGREEAVSFLELLERTGSEIGVTVGIESVAKGDVAHPLAEELRLKLRVSGTWSEVVKYIGLLELLPLQSKLEQLVVSQSEKDGVISWQGAGTLVVFKEK